MKKRGAIELSISTIIVVVLAVLMLALGTFMVKKTMCAAIGGVDQMNDLVKNQLQDLFGVQSNNVAVKELINEIPKEIYYGVAFGIKNEDKKDNTKFTYEVSAIDLGDCKIKKEDAEKYIILGKSGSVNIAAGDTYADLIKFKIPKGAQLCNLKYQISVKNNGELYGTSTFEVIIKKASLINSVLC